MRGLARRAATLLTLSSSHLTAGNSKLLSNMSVEGRVLSFTLTIANNSTVMHTANVVS